jgi:uncharacterized phage protein (TIGR02218 family)
MTTYQEYEASVASGEPVELYDVFNTEGTHWRMNSSNETITYGAYDYEPDVLDRSEIVVGGNIEKSSLELKLKKNHDFANQFIGNVSDFVVSINIYRQHAGQCAALWSGKLVGVKFDENSIPTCMFEPGSSTGQRVGDRRRCQKLCDHVLYSPLPACGVDMDSYGETGIIDDISSTGLNIQSSTFAGEAGDWFLGGVIKISDAYRFILYHSSNVIYIDRPFNNAQIGDTFTVYAGCDLSANTCRNKFNNILNFGGLEFLSVEDPFAREITQ